MDWGYLGGFIDVKDSFVNRSGKHQKVVLIYNTNIEVLKEIQGLPKGHQSYSKGVRDSKGRFQKGQHRYGFQKGHVPWNKSKHYTEESKKKISLALKGKPKPKLVGNRNGFKNGQLPWNKGKRSSEESRHKMSLAHKGRVTWNKGISPSEETRKKISLTLKGSWTGPKNPNWAGGVSYEPYSPLFNGKLKEYIRKRDNYTCQLCGRNQKEEIEEIGAGLTVHHIDYDKKNSVSSNLITLCKVCNNKVNANRGFWEKYFQRMASLKATIQGMVNRIEV